MKTYILVDKVPVEEPDLRKWGEWMVGTGPVVARTEQVSTLFLGMDANGTGDMFETLILTGPKSGLSLRCNTREQGPCDYPLAGGEPGRPALCNCTRYVGKLSNPQSWLIEWESATGAGNDFATYPDHLTRAQVIARWESAHHGCYVTRLISKSSRFEETRSCS